MEKNVVRCLFPTKNLSVEITFFQKLASENFQSSNFLWEKEKLYKIFQYICLPPTKSWSSCSNVITSTNTIVGRVSNLFKISLEKKSIYVSSQTVGINCKSKKKIFFLKLVQEASLSVPIQIKLNLGFLRF